ncbi:MAG: glycosyltransferase family 2 protein [Alphaproteobacteria bacterium]|nr:glycosyltransferase family 2 protein [Alphaproteobacteria bacterium]
MTVRALRIGGGATPIDARPTAKMSVVIPCYNESENLPILLERVCRVMTGMAVPFEIIVVDDGSRDATWQVVSGAGVRIGELRGLRLSRNFGKEAALTAGIDATTGAAIVLLDADLQHPPELIPRLVERWHHGADMVYAVRTSRQADPWTRRLVTRGYYWLFRRLSDVELPMGAGDFRLLDRCVIDALSTLPERVRFMKGLYAWVGFSHEGVEFEPPRRTAGISAMNLRRLTRFGFDGIVAFSRLPLIVAAWLGALVAAPALVIGGWLLLRTLVYGVDVPGYASTIVSVMVLGGVQLLTLGLLGAYVGRLYEEAKQRPIYLVRDAIGLGDPGIGAP